MNTAALISGLLARDLRALSRELDAYPSEDALWEKPPTIPNSAGTLAAHMAGNIRHYVGAVLGQSGYVRDRDAEFSGRRMPRAELQAGIAAAIHDVETVLPTFTDAQLATPFPQKVADLQVETSEFLLHLAVHLTYHLGQVDYHRRLVGGSSTSVSTVSPKELRTARAS